MVVLDYVSCCGYHDSDMVEKIGAGKESEDQQIKVQRSKDRAESKRHKAKGETLKSEILRDDIKDKIF